MSPIKKYRLAVSEEELKILENAVGYWKTITRYEPESALFPNKEGKEKLLVRGEHLHNRIIKLLSLK